MEDHIIELRQNVWEAISNFYLDTELDASDYDYLASIFEKSDYSIEELKHIDLYEVFPTLYMNLLSIAGEWAGFNQDWLNEKCYKNYNKKESFTFKMKIKILNKLHYWMRKGNWEEIERRINTIL